MIKTIYAPISAIIAMLFFAENCMFGETAIDVILCPIIIYASLNIMGSETNTWV